VLSIEIDTSEVVGALNALTTELEEAIMKEAIEPYLLNVQSTARSSHRFNSRTGNLERSIQVSMDSTGGSVYVSEGSAPYGKYVHNGHKTWSPDTFLDDAADANRGLLDTVCDRATENAINKVGL